VFAVFILAMATYSSGESYKPHSPQKAFILGELKEAKRSLAQKDATIRQLEERLQRLGVTHDRSNHGSRHSHRHSSRSSSNSHGHEEESGWRRHHHHEDRRQNVAKPYFPFVKLPSFSGDGDPNVYLGWEEKVEQIFHVHKVTEDQKVRVSLLSFCTDQSLGVD